MRVLLLLRRNRVLSSRTIFTSHAQTRGPPFVSVTVMWRSVVGHEPTGVSNGAVDVNRSGDHYPAPRWALAVRRPRSLPPTSVSFQIPTISHLITRASRSASQPSSAPLHPVRHSQWSHRRSQSTLRGRFIYTLSRSRMDPLLIDKMAREISHRNIPRFHPFLARHNGHGSLP